MSEQLRIQRSPIEKLCLNCHNIFDHWDDIKRNLRKLYYSAVDHYQDSRMWIALVNDGCVLCMRMFDGLTIEKAQELSQPLALGFDIAMQTQICLNPRCMLLYTDIHLPRDRIVPAKGEFPGRSPARIFTRLVEPQLPGIAVGKMVMSPDV